jgi:hypothetical protein
MLRFPRLRRPGHHHRQGLNAKVMVGPILRKQAGGRFQQAAGSWQKPEFGHQKTEGSKAGLLRITDN